MAEPARVAVLHGDQTGEELLQVALRFLDPELTGVPVVLEHFDLSLATRRQSNNQVVLEPPTRCSAPATGSRPPPSPLNRPATSAAQMQSFAPGSAGR